MFQYVRLLLSEYVIWWNLKFIISIEFINCYLGKVWLKLDSFTCSHCIMIMSNTNDCSNECCFWIEKPHGRDFSVGRFVSWNIWPSEESGWIHWPRQPLSQSPGLTSIAYVAQHKLGDLASIVDARSIGTIYAHSQHSTSFSCISRSLY